MKICQSCGMPMETVEMQGNNKNSTKNDEYCKYCYPVGAFNNPEETFEEMVSSCIPFCEEKGMSKEEAKAYLDQTLRPLKRWNQ